MRCARLRIRSDDRYIAVKEAAKEKLGLQQRKQPGRGSHIAVKYRQRGQQETERDKVRRNSRRREWHLY